MTMLLRYALVLFLAGAVHAGETRIAVDVGHSLLDSGAISARGRTEFAFNLDLARQFPQALGAQDLLFVGINLAGEVPALADRSRQAGEAGAALLLSIHHDSVSEAFLLDWVYEGQMLTHTEAKRGFGLFVSRRNPRWQASLACASAMGAALRQRGFSATDFHARKHEAADAENGVWFYDNLVVLHQAVMPAVLLEAGVIKHREEELELRSSARQANMAYGIASGIRACIPALTERPVQE